MLMMHNKLHEQAKPLQDKITMVSNAINKWKQHLQHLQQVQIHACKQMIMQEYESQQEQQELPQQQRQQLLLNKCDSIAQFSRM